MSSTDTPRSGWFKSSFSDSSNNCVVVRFSDELVLIRDDKYRGEAHLQPTIAIPAAHWPDFLELALGQNVPAADIGLPTISADESGARITDAVGTTLLFTDAEWTAFTAGIRAGEFSPAAA